VLAVEAKTSFVQGRDACQNGQDPLGLCLLKKAFQESRSDPFPAVIGMNELRGLGGMGKRGERVIGMDHSKSDQHSFPCFHDKRRVVDDDLQEEVIELVGNALFEVGGV
jgi:hypothetical protein